jgi:hypothetical protein
MHFVEHLVCTRKNTKNGGNTAAKSLMHEVYAEDKERKDELQLWPEQ